MVQVIHSYRGSYPFGLKKQTEHTYVQILKQSLSQEQIVEYRQKSRIYREISSVHFVKLLKILKQQNNLHFLYEYYETSLQAFVDNLRKDNDEALNRARFKAISDEFKSNVDNIAEELIKSQIKIDLCLCDLAVMPKKQEGEKAVLKIFINCDAEYLCLGNHKYRPKDNKWKTLGELNHSFLREFYEAEKKRLLAQFDDVLGLKLGKFITADKKTLPNFVIIGTKLVFLNTEDKYKPVQNEDYSKGNRVEDNRMTVSSKEIQKPLVDSLKNSRADTKSASNLTKPILKPKIERIVNFDQSFQPEFKPEQFTKQNTYIFQQNDYLQSLEEELNKINIWKKVQQPKNSSEEKTTKNNVEEETKKSKENSTHKIVQKKDSQQFSNSLIKADSQNSSNAGNTSNSPVRLPYDKIVQIQPERTEKTNKYRMKIITSHEIEIEGGQQQNAEQLERQIMADIRSGKLNINQLASSNINNSSLVKNQSINSSNQHSNSNEYLITSITKSKNPETPDNREQIGNQKAKRYFQQQVEHRAVAKQMNLKQSGELVLKGANKSLSTANSHDINEESKQAKVDHKIYTVASYHQNKQQKEQQTDIPHQKTDTTEDYLSKIREVKNRAEQILKGYAKKKQ